MNFLMSSRAPTNINVHVPPLLERRACRRNIESPLQIVTRSTSTTTSFCIAIRPREGPHNE
jgi:hypothetical protein